MGVTLLYTDPAERMKLGKKNGGEKRKHTNRRIGYRRCTRCVCVCVLDHNHQWGNVKKKVAPLVWMRFQIRGRLGKVAETWGELETTPLFGLFFSFLF